MIWVFYLSWKLSLTNFIKFGLIFHSLQPFKAWFAGAEDNMSFREAKGKLNMKWLWSRDCNENNLIFQKLKNKEMLTYFETDHGSMYLMFVERFTLSSLLWTNLRRFHARSLCLKNYINLHKVSKKFRSHVQILVDKLSEMIYFYTGCLKI